jgi:putative salt-induced outer membrane protein YdiY
VGFVAFALTFAGSLPAAAQQTLVLADGDQLTGALKSASPDTWIFTFRGQDVEIATADIASFTAPEPIGLRLSDNSIVAATVSPVTDGLELVLADGTSRTVTPADFEATGSPDDLEALQEVQLGYFTPFSKFWALSASLGASTRSGNTESSSLNARLDVDRATERDRLALAFLATEEQTRPPDGDSKEQTAQKFIGNIRADIFPWTRVFLFGENRYTRDRFADIDLRVNLNLGSGIQITKTDKTDIRAALGLGGRYENFTSDAESETVGTMNVNGQWNQKFGGFEFSTALDVTPALQDFNDYQLLSDSNLTATLIAGFGFRVGLLVQYDNTPAPGFDTTDTTLITALNYNLGR